MELYPSAQSSSRKDNLSILQKTSLKTEILLSHSTLFHMKTRVFLKFFARGCSFLSYCAVKFSL